MRILGLDLGTKTLGLAISDKTNTISSPFLTLRYTSYQELIEKLKGIIEEKEIGTLILGYPKNMNNSSGPAVERTLCFKEELEINFDLPIILMDERLSTSEAENLVIDSYAAAIILDTYLKRK